MKTIATVSMLDKSEFLHFIRSCDPYKALTAQEMDILHLHMKMATLEKGRFIYLPGQPSDQISIIYSGSVRLATLTESGREFTSSLYHPGETFGELCLAGETVRVEMAIACEKTTLITFKQDTLIEMVRQNLLFTLSLIRLIGTRRHETENKLLQLFYTPVHSRLAKLLIHFATKYEKGLSQPPIQLRLTHEVLASLAGTTRETTTMILNRFEKLGLIHKSKGNIFIKDLQLLKTFSQSRNSIETKQTVTLPRAV